MFNNDVNIGWAAQTEKPLSQPLITVHLPEYQSLITASLNIPQDRGGVKAGIEGDGPRRSVSHPLCLSTAPSLSPSLTLNRLTWVFVRSVPSCKQTNKDSTNKHTDQSERQQENWGL